MATTYNDITWDDLQSRVIIRMVIGVGNTPLTIMSHGEYEVRFFAKDAAQNQATAGPVGVTLDRIP